jgi:hypothetical protein
MVLGNFNCMNYGLKTSEGTNVVYSVSKINNVWTITDEKKKQGKMMEKKLLWYIR